MTSQPEPYRPIAPQLARGLAILLGGVLLGTLVALFGGGASAGALPLVMQILAWVLALVGLALVAVALVRLSGAVDHLVTSSSRPHDVP
ncbi:hypothetical protein [Cellulomonas palmilytica]|uniref:hypothetical protein n=1 Tax=Cellulomonas palmilytica TaxID=2608402 RepID=UPI001F222A68|nr:hypothetical protein [Cellulomonas palmilytica]UJP40246.1 hypothetical protein F1D97_01505 [Cellulomonas palmilytica]